MVYKIRMPPGISCDIWSYHQRTPEGRITSTLVRNEKTGLEVGTVFPGDGPGRCRWHGRQKTGGSLEKLDYPA